VASKFKTAAQPVVPLKEVVEKSLPATPIPSPLLVVGRQDKKHKRHSSGEIVGSPPVTPRRILSKRRTSMPGPPKSMIPSSSSPKAQKAKERAMDTIVVLDHESGSLRRKRIHRRSATVHAHPGEIPIAVGFEGIHRPLTADLHVHAPELNGTVTTASTPDSQAGAGNGSGVLSSLRRSLSLGRSVSGRPRSRSRDGKTAEGGDEARGRPPPVPRLPMKVQVELEQMKQQHASVNQAEITPPVSRDSKAAVSEKPPGHGGVAGAVMAGIASIKKRKSKAHLLHPSGQFHLAGSGSFHDQKLVSTTTNTHANDQAMETDQRDISIPAPSHIKRTRTAPMPLADMKAAPQKGGNKSRNPGTLKISPTATRPAAQAASVNPQTPTTPRTKTRRNSSAISNLLSLRPKSRTGMSALVPPEPVPPLPVSALAKPFPQTQQEQTLAIKDCNVGNSAILAGIRDLRNGKKAQAATPGFRLQGISEATTQAEARSARRVSLVGSSHTVNTKGGPESGKKSHVSPAGGPPAQTRGKNSFLVKFCKSSPSLCLHDLDIRC